MKPVNDSRSLFRTSLIAVLIVLFLLPLLWTLSLSIRPDTALFSQPPQWFFQAELDSYRNVLTDPRVQKAVVNSLILSISTTLAVVAIGTPAAYSLARYRLKRRDDVLLFVLAGRLVLPVVMLMPYFIIFQEIGLRSTRLGLVIAYTAFNLPFFIWIMTVFAGELPADLETAAQVDGYSGWRMWRTTILPLLRPGLVATAVLVYIFSWSELAFAAVVGGSDVETLPVVISRFITGSGIRWGELAAVATISVVPVMVLAAGLHKFIVRGLALGAVKG